MATLRPIHTLTQMPKNPTLVVATPKRLGALPVASNNNNKPLGTERVKLVGFMWVSPTHSVSHSKTIFSNPS